MPAEERSQVTEDNPLQTASSPRITQGDNEEALLMSYSERLAFPFRKRISHELKIKENFSIPIHFFRRMGLVPLFMEEDTLCVAINDPSNYAAADDLGRIVGARRVRLVLSTLEEIQSAINTLYDQSSDDAEKMVADLGESELGSHGLSGIEEMVDLLDVTHEAPIIRLVNVILTQALRRKASDVHIEPYMKETKVRFRLDGILYEVFSLPRRFHSHVVSRIKVMTNLDIAEKRVPQDGRMKIKVANKEVDIRVSIIPMTFGERIVLRLLDKTVSLLGMGEMGLDGDHLKTLERLINKNSGIFLVTGPTGSGKTTTLYAALNRINTSGKNIVTIEDPVEYELRGVGQIQVNPKTALTFARGLRSILRHDPDIIMVGEIRDLETVEIAIQASLTGHMVFSTLHTNDAATALTRLVDMGAEPFLIASSLLGVLAQRLVRTICPSCREAIVPDPATMSELGLAGDQVLYHGKGCAKCFRSGFRGRTGIFELLLMDQNIRQLLTSGADAVTVRQAAVQNGMRTLYEDGIRKVVSGITTLSEVMRVTQE
jgi:general secretion pathway protein E